MIWYNKSWFQVMRSWFNLIHDRCHNIWQVTWRSQSQTRETHKQCRTIYQGQSLLFKTRRVYREMQHDHVTSEHINITLEKLKSKELFVEMEVALEEEVALVDVIGRRDGAWSTALWTAWDTAEAIDLDISSDMVCEFPVSETEIVMWLVSCTGTYHVLS